MVAIFLYEMLDEDEWSNVTIVVNWAIPIHLQSNLLRISVLRAFSLVLAPRGGDGGVAFPRSRDVPA